MTKEILKRIEEIEARAKKATPGPWIREDYSAGWSIIYAKVLKKGAPRYQICDFATRDDAEFIAGCREDTPWLCELVRRLLAVAEAARAYVALGRQFETVDPIRESAKRFQALEEVLAKLEEVK